MILHRLRPAAARAAACFVLLGSLLGAGPAAARTLHWSLLDVDARIDAEGALNVVETQHMVFDGDWNGGERVFRLGPGHEIVAFSLARIDPESGVRHPMVAGDLDAVDHFTWVDGTTVRWRSRLPSDPPFRNQTLVYELSYRMTGVLHARGEGVYHLWHDFAFTDRDGPIERFVLELEIDPAFEPMDPLPNELVRENLPPGLGVEVQGDLRYLPEGRPAAAVPPGASPMLVMLLFAAVVAAAIWMTVDFFRGERAVGRSAWTVPQPPEVDRGWIEREIVRLRPEVVGALWDRKVRAAEVSALIARLVGEGKLESSVEKDPKSGKENLRLRQLAPDGDFRGYEADLVSKLFFGGTDEVTTSELRKHYKTKGFDPAGVISGKLGKRVEREVPGAGLTRRAPSKLPALVLVVTALACFVIEALLRPAAAPGLIVPLFFVIPPLYLFGSALAAATRGQIERLVLLLALYLVPLAAMTFGSALFLLGLGPGGAVPAGPFGVLAVVLANLAAWRSVTHMAMTRESREAIAARRKLLHARRYFERELDRERPDLDDAWFPYLLAFGLSRALDRWSKAFGGESAGSAALAGAGASSWTGTWGSSGGGWTGGGGQFGGAGASGAWAVAATGLATGVAAPGSSGGGSSGGGGGSSGGGGGGGW